jgi:thiamine monophosphate synthase
MRSTKLKLVFFTDRKKFDDIFEVINNLPKNAIVIVREYDLSYVKRLEFATKVKLIAAKKSLKVLAGKSLKMAIAIKADGVHFSDKDKFWSKYLYCKKIGRKNFIFSLSCHKIKSLKLAQKFNFDMVFYSPIFETKSHQDQKCIGISKFRKIALENFYSFGAPLYALGGISQANIGLLRGCKIVGVGGISQIIYL